MCPWNPQFGHSGSSDSRCGGVRGRFRFRFRRVCCEWAIACTLAVVPGVVELVICAAWCAVASHERQIFSASSRLMLSFSKSFRRKPGWAILSTS